MSKQIDVMPCDFCKADCPHADLSIKHDLLWGDGEVKVNTRKIVCSHEEACRMQRERKG